ARLMVLAPDEVTARLGASTDYGTGQVRLGVTADAARDGALAMLATATAALDPQSALPPRTAAVGAPDHCVAVGERPRGCPEGLNATVLPDDRARLITARVAGAAECEGTASVLTHTTVPARVTVTWWSPGDPVRTLDADTTDAPTCIQVSGAADRYE